MQSAEVAAAGAAIAAASKAVATSQSNAEELGKYDEAICFVNAAGGALAGMAYTLFLEGGRCIEGRTDGQGRTGRVVTQAPERILRAELRPDEVACCPMHFEQCCDAPEAVEIQLENISTSSDGFGSSTKEVETPKGDARGLTSGEIDMAKLVFGDSVDYSKVKVHNKEYLWFGLQHDDIAMTPNGEMYFNPKHFKEDFSNPADLGGQRWFIHEMTHVWQHQLGYPVKWRGAVRLGLSYRYALDMEKRLSDYNMEAQGNILADYFVVKHRGRQRAMYEEQYWYDENALALLEAVLSDFLEEPESRRNLPS